MKIVLLLLSSLAFSQAGSIYFLKGDVFVNGVKVNKGQILNVKDQVRTGKDALVILSLKPATKIKLKALTQFNIEEIRKTKSTTSFRYFLKTGEAFVRAHRSKRNRYNVRTKHATMGVRGTQFFISTKESKGSKDWMCVDEGRVEVKVNETKGFVLVEAGEGVAISRSKLPSVKKYKWTQKLNWNFEGDYNSVKDNTNIQNINYNLEDVEYE